MERFEFRRLYARDGLTELLGPLLSEPAVAFGLQRPCKEAAKRGKALPYRAGAQEKWRPTLQGSKKISSLKVREYACAVKKAPSLPPPPEKPSWAVCVDCGRPDGLRQFASPPL